MLTLSWRLTYLLCHAKLVSTIQCSYQYSLVPAAEIFSKALVKYGYSKYDFMISALRTILGNSPQSL